MKIVEDIAVLRQKSTPVESVEEASFIIEKLEDALSTKKNGVGLAAIQIGIPKRVGVIKYDGEIQYLINPEILEKEDEFVFGQEGCLSFPGTYLNTKRFRQITVKNQVIKDGEFEDELFCLYHPPKGEDGGDSLIPIAVQHELDHFDGKLIIDHGVKTIPYVRGDKIGRNDLCYCGSGKKYKKCCMDKD